MQHHVKIPSHVYNAIKDDPTSVIIQNLKPTIVKTRHILSFFTGNTITSTYTPDLNIDDIQKMINANRERSELYHIMHRKRVHTTLTVILLLSIIFALFVGLYVKPTVQHESWKIFIEHFTNWSWVFQCVFYISVTVIFMFFSHTKILDYIFACCLTTLAGTVCSVAIMVFLNMGSLEQYWIFEHSSSSSSSSSSAYDSSDISSSEDYYYHTINYFIDTFSSFRPDQTSPFDINPYIQNVLIGSELYHTFPVIFFLLTSIFMFKYIKRSFYYVFAGYSKFDLYCVRIILLFTPVLFMAIYASIFNPLAVYHVKGPLVLGLLLVALISFIVNYCILNFFMPCPMSKSNQKVFNHHALKTFRDEEHNLYTQVMNFANTDHVHLYKYDQHGRKIKVF
jgi:hypothetical protein